MHLSDNPHAAYLRVFERELSTFLRTVCTRLYVFLRTDRTLIGILSANANNYDLPSRPYLIQIWSIPAAVGLSLHLQNY